ncbi:ASTRA complex subunit [Didymella keratinophila]|nr:ASTRA complex subunit [Didymella keratinophila]
MAERQSSTLPPAQPSYILRGHASQIHSVQFVRENTRLVTGDADGWVIYWKLETKRALAVWKAHDGAILGTADWGHDKIITHGRDNSLRIWQPNKTCASVLIAVPARDDKKAEVYQFPEEKLRYVVPRAQAKDTGMVMAVKLIRDPSTQQNLVITGYEGGLTAVHLLPKADDSIVGVAQLLYLSQPHTQPILSIDVLPDATTYYTSGADAIIAAHRLPKIPSGFTSPKKSPSAPEHEDDPPVSVPAVHTETSPGLTSSVSSEDYRTDEMADDPPVSVPEDADDQPLSFSKRPLQSSKPAGSTSKAGGLSSLLSTATASKAAQAAPPSLSPPSIQAPFKVNNTKHAGQQSLSVRSDGRLLATGGWDTRVRIYSTKTLKEVAVLKWHKEGVYAVAFGEILDAVDLEHNVQDASGQDTNTEVIRRETGLSKLQRQREEKMQIKHWIAAGAKDGKISLWEVF